MTTSKFYDKELFYIVNQPAGGRLEINVDNSVGEFCSIREAARFSQRNCRKHVLGGGFNSTSSELEKRVYGSKDPFRIVFIGGIPELVWDWSNYIVSDNVNS